MAPKPNRPADGSSAELHRQPSTPTPTTVDPDVDHVGRFRRAWTGEDQPTPAERASAVRLLIDMLAAEHRAFGSPETSHSERQMIRLILGEALDCGVLRDHDVHFALECAAVDATVRPRATSATFRPMAIRGAIVAESETSIAVAIGTFDGATAVLVLDRATHDVEMPS